MNKVEAFLEKFPNVETERLQLNKYTIDVVNDMYEIFSNDEVTKYLRKFTSLDDAEKVVIYKIENAVTTTKREWVISRKEDNKVIGTFSLKFDLENNSVKIGYVLGFDYWHNGYAFEICNYMIALCFNELDVKNVYADTVSTNEPSIKLLIKLGFQYLNTQKGKRSFNYYAISQEDYLNK